MSAGIDKNQINLHKRRGFIDIYKPIAGWKAVQYWWNLDMGGFWEPLQTGFCAFSTAKEAYEDAKSWADAEDLPYIIHPELE